MTNTTHQDTDYTTGQPTVNVDGIVMSQRQYDFYINAACTHIMTLCRDRGITGAFAETALAHCLVLFQAGKSGIGYARLDTVAVSALRDKVVADLSGIGPLLKRPSRTLRTA